MNDQRGYWHLLTSFILGVTMGLIYSWLLSPVQYVDTAPASLREDFKQEYRALIAVAYNANGDIGRASARLELLDDPQISETLANQAQTALAEGRSLDEVRALGKLAAHLNDPTGTSADPNPGFATTQSADAHTPAPGTADATNQGDSPLTPSRTPTPTRIPRNTTTPTPTGTPRPTNTATATQGAPFMLESRESVCDADLVEPLIMVWVEDAGNNPVPGVEIIVTWSGGEDHFFTGFKPEFGLGYADFSMNPGEDYQLSLLEGGGDVISLSDIDCVDEGGDHFWGSWQLIFHQP